MDSLSAVVVQPEGKTLEFKRDLSSPEGVLRTLVAFANTAGGTLVIGVEDKTRHVVGVSDPLALEERLANGIVDQVAPLLVPDIEILPWRRTHVLVVRVHPSPTRPHYLKRLGPERGVFVRVGSTNRLADATLIEELRRYSRNETFDEQPMTELDSEAIDFRAASESLRSSASGSTWRRSSSPRGSVPACRQTGLPVRIRTQTGAARGKAQTGA